MSSYADHITTLAPGDPAHVEAWMRLEHDTLDGLSSWHFARQVQTALSCVEAAGLDECDRLARSFGLRPRYSIGDRVLVAREGGLEPAGAVIDAENEHRPHLVKVKYLALAHGRLDRAQADRRARRPPARPAGGDDRAPRSRTGMEARRDRDGPPGLRVHAGRARRRLHRRQPAWARADACQRRAAHKPTMTAARPKLPGPYDGHPFAPISARAAAEHAWGRGLVGRGWPELGWCVVGRDGAGHLVAATILPCGIADAGRRERHCYQTFTPAGLVYRSQTVTIDEAQEPT